MQAGVDTWVSTMLNRLQFRFATPLMVLQNSLGVLKAKKEKPNNSLQSLNLGRLEWCWLWIVEHDFLQQRAHGALTSSERHIKVKCLQSRRRGANTKHTRVITYTTLNKHTCADNVWYHQFPFTVRFCIVRCPTIFNLLARFLLLVQPQAMPFTVCQLSGSFQWWDYHTCCYKSPGSTFLCKQNADFSPTQHENHKTQGLQMDHFLQHSSLQLHEGNKWKTLRNHRSTYKIIEAHTIVYL